MRTIRNVETPTGNILVVKGDYGLLECLSLGDYGKDVNLKADFLGLDRLPSRVRHTDIMPLTDKWVATISTQYGCSMGCSFCDVPVVGPGRNATFQDLIDQVYTILYLHQEIRWSNRLNIHFARMGEPTFNPNVLDAARFFNAQLQNYNVHPVVSTMMPASNIWLREFIRAWMRIKNEDYAGNAGLQISINSTSTEERRQIFNNQALDLFQINNVMRGIIPKGRKITLNFAVAGFRVDPDVLLTYFDPELYLIKLTPMHKTTRATKNNLVTMGDYTEYYPYAQLELDLRSAGYDVIVFIASKEEDESMITCGNAVLAQEGL